MRVCFSTASPVENHFLPPVCNFVPRHRVGREVQTSYRSQISYPIICTHTSLPYFPFHMLLEMTDKRTGALLDYGQYERDTKSNTIIWPFSTAGPSLELFGKTVIHRKWCPLFPSAPLPKADSRKANSIKRSR